MAIGNLNVGVFKNLTATANVKASQGALLGFYVNSTTSGTIQFYDDAATDTTAPITGVITPAIGWHNLPVGFGSGLYAVVGGTANITIVYA
jgi:hypothetical protein